MRAKAEALLDSVDRWHDDGRATREEPPMPHPAFLEVDPDRFVTWESLLADPALKAKALTRITERLRALAAAVRMEMRDVRQLAGDAAGRAAWEDFRASALHPRTTRFAVEFSRANSDEEPSEA